MNTSNSTMSATSQAEGTVESSYGKGTVGVKDDKGKVMARLIFSYFPNALLEVGKVSTMGAQKYAPGGWKTVPNWKERYHDAMGRHYLQQYIEDKDPESGYSHLAHVAWNALAILELELRNKQNDE